MIGIPAGDVGSGVVYRDPGGGGVRLEDDLIIDPCGAKDRDGDRGRVLHDAKRRPQKEGPVAGSAFEIIKSVTPAGVITQHRIKSFDSERAKNPMGFVMDPFFLGKTLFVRGFKIL